MVHVEAMKCGSVGYLTIWSGQCGGLDVEGLVNHTIWVLSPQAASVPRAPPLCSIFSRRQFSRGFLTFVLCNEETPRSHHWPYRPRAPAPGPHHRDREQSLEYREHYKSCLSEKILLPLPKRVGQVMDVINKHFRTTAVSHCISPPKTCFLRLEHLYTTILASSYQVSAEYFSRSKMTADRGVGDQTTSPSAPPLERKLSHAPSAIIALYS
ncbi:uncharacterized protein [Dendrobates tinctorius]|uniref:uncharacterized protein n=1 Tax=Dendrobates tinctorius TaxID=92724 RepID=UPI003CC99DC1